jgi:hypothetical protein
MRGDAVEGRRSIHIPEHGEGSRAYDDRNASFEQCVEGSDPAGLDHEIGGRGFVKRTQHPIFIADRVNHHSRPIRVGNVAMRLSVERIGLIEGDAMAPCGQAL